MTTMGEPAGISDAIYTEARELFEDDFRVRDLAKILHEKAKAEFERDLLVGALKEIVGDANLGAFTGSPTTAKELHQVIAKQALSALQRVGSGKESANG